MTKKRTEWKPKYFELKGRYSELKELKEAKQENPNKNKESNIFKYGQLITAFLLCIITYKQCELLNQQNIKIDHQNQLIEAERRSSLVFLLNNTLDAIDDEIKLNSTRILSDQLTARIIALSNSLKPYKYYRNSKIIEKKISPERGQLLTVLIGSEIAYKTLDEIFAKGNFTYSELEGVNLSKAYLKKINLSNSNLYNTNFKEAQLSHALLINCNIDSTNFAYSHLTRASIASEMIKPNFVEAKLISTDFTNSKIRLGNFSRSTIDNTKFHSCELKECFFYESEFEKGEFILKHIPSNDNPSDYERMELNLTITTNCGPIREFEIENLTEFKFDFDSLYFNTYSEILKSTFLDSKWNIQTINAEQILAIRKKN